MVTISVIKRILRFNKQDWKHIGWLFKNTFIQFFVKYNWHETKEGLIFIKIHLMYDSERVE